MTTWYSQFISHNFYSSSEINRVLIPKVHDIWHLLEAWAASLVVSTFLNTSNHPASPRWTSLWLLVSAVIFLKEEMDYICWNPGATKLFKVLCLIIRFWQGKASFQVRTTLHLGLTGPGRALHLLPWPAFLNHRWRHSYLVFQGPKEPRFPSRPTRWGSFRVPSFLDTVNSL